MALQDGHCRSCGEQYTDIDNKWCKSCILKKILPNRSSGNEKIDNLIQEMRLRINFRLDHVFEWISYNQFDNIKKIGGDGLVALYSANWKIGPLNYDMHTNKYERLPYKQVALKCLRNSQNINKV